MSYVEVPTADQFTRQATGPGCRRRLPGRLGQPTKEGEHMLPVTSYPVEICPSCSAVVRVYHYDRRLFTHKLGRAGPLCPRSGTITSKGGRASTKIT